MIDGVYIPQKDQTYLFQRLPHTTHEDLQILANKIKIKIERKLQKFNLEQKNQLPFEEESLSDIAQLSITQRAAFGKRAGDSLHGTRPDRTRSNDRNLQ